MITKVAVGSKNPVKFVSVKEAFEMVWPDKKWEIISLDVPSGVSNQPMTHTESIQGAKNRADNALKETGADFGVGLILGLFTGTISLNPYYFY